MSNRFLFECNSSVFTVPLLCWSSLKPNTPQLSRQIARCPGHAHTSPNPQSTLYRPKTIGAGKREIPVNHLIHCIVQGTSRNQGNHCHHKKRSRRHL